MLDGLGVVVRTIALYYKSAHYTAAQRAGNEIATPFDIADYQL
ncbi:hypothetical protein [Hoeflea ulvae]|uniref:Uncharacterized protein n=1 Tax=Hoeflea ulvae TaxID=2983764 RepID=A0ABT3YDW7_9HYPH|nr:hypothetical protein [Hoeflea ulvae]MCY0093872.1 hypothetical protein [Hoeflea ulvae]